MKSKQSSVPLITLLLGMVNIWKRRIKQSNVRGPAFMLSPQGNAPFGRKRSGGIGKPSQGKIIDKSIVCPANWKSSVIQTKRLLLW